MNKNAKKWVKALRSGKYKQTQYFLRNEGGFCCLGVACDLYNSNHWDGARYLSKSSSLPQKVADWLGLRDKCGSYDDSRIDRNLTYLNDQKGMAFNEIADFIEENWISLKKIRRKK